MLDVLDVLDVIDVIDVVGRLGRGVVGLLVHLAAGTPDPDLDTVLDLVEHTVRKQPAEATASPKREQQ